MKTQRTIISTGNGQTVPVTKNLNVKPLTLHGDPIINGHGRQIMDDQWIYVNWPHYGDEAMNVNRAQYCERFYREISILDSIGHKKTTKKLNRFTKEVSDMLIFKKGDITYQVFLKKSKSGFDLSCVKPYWISNHAYNVYYKDLPDRYKKVVNPPSRGEWTWGHELTVDLKKAFNFSTDEN